MESGDSQKRLIGSGCSRQLISSILPHLAPVLLFIFLPLMLAVYLGYHAILIEKEKHLERVAGDLDTSLVQLNCEIDAEIFLKKVARGSYRKFMSSQADPEAFASYYAALTRFLPVDFDLYAFDRHGTLASPVNAQLRSKYLATRLWEIINCAPIEQNKRLYKIKRSLRSFLGDEFRMSQFLEGRDSCLPIIVRHRNGYIYWYNDPMQPASGILMIFWEIPDLDFRARQVTTRQKSNFASGFLARNEESHTPYGVEGIQQQQAAEIFRKVAFLGESKVFDERERLWSAKNISGLWVFAALKSNLTIYVNSQAGFLAFSLLLVILAICTYIWAVRSRALYISIRVKLMVLFLTAVASPIMGFIYLGYSYLDDRQQNLHAAIANQSRKLLFTLDESFKGIGANFLDDFFSLSRRVANSIDDDFNRDVLARIEANELISVELRDTSNAEISYFTQNEMYFEGMREVSDAFSRFCIDTVLGSRLADAVDPILEMVVRSPEAGMSFFFSRPGEVHKMEFGPVPLFLFWDIFKNSENRQVYVYIVQSANRLLRRLMRQQLKSNLQEKASFPFVLAASHRKTEEWLPFRIKSAPGLQDFSNRVFFSDQPVETLIKIKGEDYILTGQKGKNTRDYAFYAFYPMKIITDDIARQRRMLLAGIFLFLIVALLTGWLLSDTFLSPVARLGEGVAAIKNRDHSFRIETSQKDEFGDLALSFNHMIADLKEMQLAKDVQESLLPSSPPVIPGYDVSFANRMASAVGGDYFDVHILDNERVCVVIGDVTGHGVSSALVMAMARAIFYQGLKEGSDLISLFNDLNLAIYEYFHVPPVRKMITVFAAVINLSDGSGEFVNAGHNFPVKLSVSGICEDLAAIHLPIGACQKLRNLTAKKFSMEPGETLVFYTDGLVEVQNTQKQMYGYDRFKTVLADNASNSAAEITNELIKQYEVWLGEAEPDDDLTLIVFRRL